VAVALIAATLASLALLLVDNFHPDGLQDRRP